MKYTVWKKRIKYFAGEDIVLPEGAVIINCEEQFVNWPVQKEQYVGVKNPLVEIPRGIRITFLEPVPEPSPEPTG